MQCCAIKTDGVRCTTSVVDDNIRCRTHQNMVARKGNNEVRRNELKFTHNRNIDEIVRNNRLAGPDRDQAILIRRRLIREERFRYETARIELERLIDQEFIANGNVNPDAEIIARNRAMLEQRRNALAARWQQRHELHQRLAAERMAFDQNAVHHMPVIGIMGGLAAMAQDRQNVHTATLVSKVKKMVETILAIPVPAEYRTETMKTSGEIILECGLSRRAAWQMMAKYCQDENIYELGEGIYSRVLNSVWQFIKTSPYAEDLKKIVRSEMEDNIGMCAQGNLSRLCNILSGYMEGINPDTKSRSEIIGDLLAPLMSIENVDDRIARANELLLWQNVPGEEREVWLDPLRE